jgi:hypothetical protein
VLESEDLAFSFIRNHGAACLRTRHDRSQMTPSVTTRISSNVSRSKNRRGRSQKKTKALTAAQHAALREQLKEVHFLKPDYADNTKINIAGMLRKWKG